MNNGDTLDACLKSVVDSLPCDKEVIVVDGHSTDNTPSILAKYKDRIKVVYDDGKGLGNARNVGVHHAKHDTIAFVDSDVICAKDHFLKISNYFEEHPDVGAVDTAGIHPQTGTKTQRNESLVYETLEKYSPSQLNLRGWSIAFRRSVFDAVGGFWLGYAEDTEFSYKLKAKGVKTTTLETESWHIKRSTLRTFLSEMKFWGQTNAYFIRKWGNTPTFIKDYKKRKLFRFIPNAKAITFLAYLSAPLNGIKYFVKTRSLSFYAHFIVRQYAYLVGFIQGNWRIEPMHVKDKKFGATLSPVQSPPTALPEDRRSTAQ